MLFLWLFCLIFDGPNHYLVLKNNKVLTLREAVKVEGSVCVFQLPNGQKGSLPLSQIDQEKTKAFNEKAIADFEQERAEKAAKEAAAAEAAERKAKETAAARKQISLRDANQLPNYDHSQNRTSGFGGESEETKVTNSDWRSYNSSEPVYVSRDRITKTDAGTSLDCELAVNNEGGVKKTSVRVKVNFDDNSSETQELMSTPPDLPFGVTGRVHFDFSSKGNLLQVVYSVSAEVVPKP